MSPNEMRPSRLPSLGLDRFSGLYVWALLIVVFAIWVPDTFLQKGTAQSIAGEQSIVAILALAALVPLAANQFDLSIGAALGFCSVFCSWLAIKHGWNPFLSAAATVGLGAVIGAINGFVIVRLRVGSFIATLAMATFLGAMTVAVSGGVQIVGELPSSFLNLGGGEWLGISAPVYWLIGVAIALWYLMEHTPFGHYVYATGANAPAAKLSGVRTDAYVFGSLMISGTLSGLAGVVYLAKIGTASLTAGPPYLLPAFAALFLGATQIRPGRMNVLGTLIAVFLLATGVRGLQLTPTFGDSQWIEGVFNAVALVTAVAIAARAAGRRSEKTESAQDSPIEGPTDVVTDGGERVSSDGAIVTDP